MPFPFLFRLHLLVFYHRLSRSWLPSKANPCPMWFRLLLRMPRNRRWLSSHTPFLPSINIMLVSIPASAVSGLGSTILASSWIPHRRILMPLVPRFLIWGASTMTQAPLDAAPVLIPRQGRAAFREFVASYSFAIRSSLPASVR